MKEPYRRLTEQEVEERIGQIRHGGRFKVYIGSAPGVGKTSRDREGNDLLRKGVDVRIGLLETHNRAETASQIGNLSVIPRRVEEREGLDPGGDGYGCSSSRFVPRSCSWMSWPMPMCREVCAASVMRMCRFCGCRHFRHLDEINVQHLESLNDAVEQITGIRVRETVPDSLLRMADEVQLIDVSPRTLQQRMLEGEGPCSMSKVDRRLAIFFGPAI